MHLAIEGIDGVGKSTICKLLAEKLDFRFVEKPLHYLFDQEETFDNYYRIRDYVNTQKNKIFTSWFYGLGNIFLYHKFGEKNIVTDRHFVSNFLWSGDETSSLVFDSMIKLIGKPTFTILLYADKETVTKRLDGRNVNDPDKNKTQHLSECYAKMEKFLQDHQMDYKLIDSTNLNPNETLNIIINYLSINEII